MKFYNERMKHYHKIFPVTDEQIKFIQEHIGNSPRTVLDIACGDGGHAIELAQNGYVVTALDSSQEMIMSAQEKAELAGVEIATITCRMDEIIQHISGTFDGAFCIGNALVHLDTIERISTFFKQLSAVLKDGGKGIIQTVNYDKILKQGSNVLPITTSEQQFIVEREYKVDEKSKKFMYKTKLNLEGEIVENEVELLRVNCEEIRNIVKQSHLSIVKEYGTYDGEVFNDMDSLHYICVVEK